MGLNNLAGLAVHAGRPKYNLTLSTSLKVAFKDLFTAIAGNSIVSSSLPGSMLFSVLIHITNWKKR